jgi:hypothetical protein
MSRYKFDPLSLSKIHTTKLNERESKVNIAHFGKPAKPEDSIGSFIKSLPNILAAQDFKDFVCRCQKAKEKNKPIIVSMGAHVIKVGLNPVVLDLMQKGWIDGLAFNGAGIIHDFEISYSGQTSEDVEEYIKDGRFGMAEETGRYLNQAINQAKGEMGIGEAVGKMIEESDFPYKHYSLFANAYKLNIPVTVHVAFGTDIIHFHPDADGEAIGRGSQRDFLLFCSLIKQLDQGGVFITIGSAVILPEIFLKAVSLIRNQGTPLKGVTTAVFDFIRHYRPFQNIVSRPLIDSSKGFYFIGHHEIMIPLFAAALSSKSEQING